MRLLTVSYIIGVAVGAWLMARLPVEVLSGIVCVLLVAALVVKGRGLATCLICSAILAIGILRATQDIFSVANEVFAQDVVSESSGSFYATLLDNTAEKRGELLGELNETELSEDSKMIVGAMVLGEKSSLTENARETYSQSGASHVLAISGMHMGIIFGLLLFLVKLLPRLVYKVIDSVPNFSQAICGRLHSLPDMNTLECFAMPFVVLTIWGYAFLVVMSNSVLRSAVMLTIAAVCMLLRRQTKMPDILTLAAFTILIISPLSLFDVGFQMSFMAVLGITLYYHPLRSLLFRIVRRFDKGDAYWNSCQGRQLNRKVWFRIMRSLCITLWQIASLSLSAQLLVLPLTAFYFGTVSLTGVVSSLMLAVTAVVILWFGLLLIVMMIINGMASVSVVGFVKFICVHVLNTVIHFQNSMLESLSSLPFSHVEVNGMSIYHLSLIYIIIAGGGICLCLIARSLDSREKNR